MKKLIRNFKFLTAIVLSVIIVACEEEDALLPQIKAGFTQTISTTTGTVRFINTSENADSYEWTIVNNDEAIEDTIETTEVNPIITLPVGSYTVTLIAKNIAGAMDVFEDVISVEIPEPLEFPINFDNPAVDYVAKIVGNVSFTVVDNPQVNGINNVNSKVGQITNVGANFENAFFNLDEPINFATANSVRLKLYSDQALDVLLKFEDGTAGNVENLQSHGGTGWEELEFTLASSASYNDMVLFIDPFGTAAGTFYIDDLEQVTGCPSPPAFDSGLLTNGNFANGGTGWTAGTTAALPSEVIVTESCDTFYSVNVTAAGNPFDVNLSQTGLDITSGTNYILTFDAWSNVNREIIAGIGLSGPPFTNQSVPQAITTTRTNYTINLTANFTDNINSRVLFDLGAAVGVVNIDNVKLVVDTGGGGGTCSGGPTTDVSSFPVNFENCEGFNISFGGGQSRAIVDNPVSGGINTSDKVYRFIKETGADGFGGFQNIFNTGTFTNNSTVSFKVYATLPNQQIRIEIVAIPNDGTIGNPAPYSQTLTQANQWVEVSFDLSTNGFPSSDQTVYTMLVVKPGNVDPGTTPAEVTFYLDDFTITPN